VKKMVAFQAQVWLTNLPGVITSLATLVVALTGFYHLRKSQLEVAASAADKAEKVRTDLLESNVNVAGQLAQLQNTADDTHILVNNAMAVQLKLTAEKARRVAQLTKNPIDIAEADAADAALKEHLARQDRVNQAVEARGGAVKQADEEQK
jgi:hypothetical protein